MAYLDRNGEIRTDDQNQKDMPEPGILPTLLSSLESFANNAKRARQLDQNGVNGLVRTVVSDVNRNMYLAYLNLYLFRLNNFYDYDYTRNQEVSTMEIYKMVQTGEMANIWAPIKAKKYNKVYNPWPYAVNDNIVQAPRGDTFSDRGSVIFSYEEMVNNFFNYVKSLYSLNTEFYNLVGDINKRGATGKIINKDDLRNPGTIDRFHRINPIIYTFSFNGHIYHDYTAEQVKEPKKVLYGNFLIMKERNYIPEASYKDNKINYNILYRNEREDIAYRDLFFKPLNDDYRAMTDGFLRYATYVSLFDLTKANSFYGTYGQQEAILFCESLASFIEKFVSHARKISRLPTPAEETPVIVPNTVFKKINYTGQVINQSGGQNNLRLRGKPITVENFMKKIFVQVGIKLNELANYNPVINGSNFIPIFASNNSEVYVDNGINKVYSIFSPINGYVSNGRFHVTHKGTEDTSIRLEYARFENNSDRINLLDRNLLPGDLLKRAEKLFKEPYDFESESSITRLNSITENQNFKGRFYEKFGVYPNTTHLIGISVVEMILRYLLGSVRTSMVPRLRYEILHPKLIDCLNRTFNVRIPYGTKFIYIAFHTDRPTKVTSNEHGIGKRITDYIEDYINTGYSNKWGVTDPEIIKSIKKLEDLSGNSILNDESVDVIADVIYKVVINLISESPKGVGEGRPDEDEDRFSHASDDLQWLTLKSFIGRAEKTLTYSPYQRDRLVKRHILLPLLDDMRKNSDFS